MSRMIYNGQEFELATKTMRVARAIETAEQANSVVEAYRKQWDVIHLVLSPEDAKAVLETNNIEEVDLNKMVSVYNGIILGYESEIVGIRRQQEEEMLSSPTLTAIKDLASDMRVISEVAGKGGLK